MLKLTLFVTALICQELGNLFAYPDISDNELYYFQTSERLSAKKPDRQLKEQFSGPNILVTTVAVTCLPAYMVITVKADLFNIGLPVNAADLRLGTESQHGTSCGVIATSADEYIIEAPLTDCGTQHWVTEDALVYTNLLFYSPEPSLDGLVQTEDAVIPIKCYYGRRFNVDANPILPTWIPHQSTQFAVENLAFSLKLMTDDWHETRLSSVYLLGDMMNMEASVYMPQKDLLVFIETCVATTTPNTNSVPRYKFVDDGCVLDGQQTGSKSHFLPRPQPNKLQLQLQSFIFPQMCCEIYVTCVLKAYPLNHASGSKSKACSFIDGRWRSAEGDDQTCTSCNDVDQDPPFHQSHLDLATPIYNLKHNPTKLLPSPHRWGVLTPGMQADSAVLSPGSGSVISQSLQEPTAAWRSTMAFQKGTNLRTLELEASVGPLTVFTWKNDLGVFVPPGVKEGIPHFSSARGKKPIPHDRLWENEVYAGMEADEGNDAFGPTNSPVALPTSGSQLWEMEMTAAEALHTVNTTSSQRHAVTGPSLLVANPAMEREQSTDTVPSIYGSNSSMLKPAQLKTKLETTTSTETKQTVAEDSHGSTQKGSGGQFVK